GGVESMSRSGWANMKGDAPFMPRGPVLLLDTMWAGAGGPPNPTLLAQDAYIDMMQTAQNVADRYELSRVEIDAFALRSHQRAAARARGRVGDARARSEGDGDRARVRDPEGAGARRPEAGRDRRLGGPRGVRLRRGRDPARAAQPTRRLPGPGRAPEPQRRRG